MKEHPIIFSSPMVRAIVAGKKTITRRVVTFGTSESAFSRRNWGELDFRSSWVDQGPSPAGNRGPYLKVSRPSDGTVHRVYPRIQVEDRLWVREAFHVDGDMDEVRRQVEDLMPPQFPVLFYRATDGHDTPDAGWIWRPSIHMPRWASRLTLDVTALRPERLQEITAEDCIAEGLSSQLREHDAVVDLKQQFQELWNDINQNRGFHWDGNHWLWVITFKVRQ